MELLNTVGGPSVRLSAALWMPILLLFGIWLVPAAVAQDEHDVGPTPEALLARGIAHFSGSAMAAGLDELERASELRPGWSHAHKALAVALLRAGRFEEAVRQFEAAMGEGRARGLASGELPIASPDESLDPEVVLGLATAHQNLDHTRRAERLYRTYADLVGHTSPEAAKAYYRLHEMFAVSDAEWVDAEAELAKALAVDPAIESARLLPGFPDPDSMPEVEPYLRPVSFSEARAETLGAPDALPVLSRWVAPADTSEYVAALLEGSMQIEMLVGEDGIPSEIRVPSLPESLALPEDLISSVRRWRFDPARREGEPVSAWILFGEATEASIGETPDAAPAARDTTAAPEAAATDEYDEPPILVEQIAPEYPEAARRAGVEGIVRLELKIDASGNVKDVRVTESIPELDDAAVEAVRWWKFDPATLEGRAVPATLVVPIRFSLEGS